MKELPKNNPFKTPEGYFENFSKSLDDTLRLEKLNVPTEAGHTVPDGYFEELTQQVLSKVAPAKPKVVSLKNRFYYAAASIAAVLMVGFIFNKSVKEKPSFDTIASTAIEDYYDDYVHDFNDDELAELLPMEAVSVNDVLNTEINQEEIVDYLDIQIENLPELNNIYDEE